HIKRSPRQQVLFFWRPSAHSRLMLLPSSTSFFLAHPTCESRYRYALSTVISRKRGTYTLRKHTQERVLLLRPSYSLSNPLLLPNLSVRLFSVTVYAESAHCLLMVGHLVYPIDRLSRCFRPILRGGPRARSRRGAGADMTTHEVTTNTVPHSDRVERIAAQHAKFLSFLSARVEDREAGEVRFRCHGSLTQAARSSPEMRQVVPDLRQFERVDELSESL